jgi:colanic acid/amylovoran biosynthesis glycosyltransferase
MKKKLILFTHKFPQGKSEQTFIKFELSKLVNYFEDIEIIPEKFTGETLNLEKKIKININFKLAKKLNFFNFLIYFISHTILSSKYYKEVNKILFNKYFFFKLKIITIELTKSYIAYKWILNENKIYEKNTVLYSFWSNFLLLTFERLKIKDKSLITISRILGSDLNGFIKNDDFVPFVERKFTTLNKIILLGDYQKTKLQKFNLDNQLEVSPLGVFPQKKNINNKILFDEPIIFLSCGNLIEIKNNLLMIDFLRKFSDQTNKKVKYIMIGKGILKNEIIKKIRNNNNIIFEYHEHVESLIDFLKQNKVHFFLNFSSQEGMSFAVMESMSCGIPTIASNIAPNEYLVNRNGFIFDLKNYDFSINNLIHEVNQAVDYEQNYYLKSKLSFDFINKNLINSKCFEKFNLILAKL